MKKTLNDFYNQLMDLYGPMGWWPMTGCETVHPFKTGAVKGYHPSDFSYPKNNRQQFEIICGAILAQNTRWIGAQKAVFQLDKKGYLIPENLLTASDEAVSSAISPAGYKNIKRGYLKNTARFYTALNGKTPVRKNLLKVKGIGPETADCILLYAYKVPTFVVDAYTTRFLVHHEIVAEKTSYHQIKTLFEANLAPDVEMFQEFHALFVEHGKRFFSRKPYGPDPIKISR